MRIKVILTSIFLFLALVLPASADVTLTNITPTWSHTQVNQSTEFNFSTPYGISKVHWLLDGVEINSTDLNLSYTFPEPKTYNVSVWAETTAGNSSLLEFHTAVSRMNATEHLAPIAETHFQEYLNNITDLNATGIMATSMLPFTDVIGRMFYVVLFGLPFVFMWLNQGKLTIPVTLLMITGSTFIMLVPQTFIGAVAIFVALSWGANLYKLSRGT